jgi:DNA-binding IscR family transcriptional regulator
MTKGIAFGCGDAEVDSRAVRSKGDGLPSNMPAGEAKLAEVGLVLQGPGKLTGMQKSREGDAKCGVKVSLSEVGAPVRKALQQLQ